MIDAAISLPRPDTRSLYKSPAGHHALTTWYNYGLAHLPLPVESVWVPTRFGLTHMLAAGPREAPPVFLVTTWGGNALLWEPQLPALAQHFRVYAVDIPGNTGRSAVQQLSPITQDYAYWFHDVFQGLQISQAGVVGIGYGSWMAIRAANALPQRINRLALLSPMFFAPVSLNLMGQVAGITFNPLLSLDTKLAQFAATILAPGQTSLTPQLQRVVDWFVLLVKHARNISPNPAPPRSLLFNPPADELRQITAQTLVLVGQQEVMYYAPNAVETARRYLGNLSEAVVIPHAGHAITHNQADLVNQRLIHFLA